MNPLIAMPVEPLEERLHHMHHLIEGSREELLTDPSFAQRKDGFVPMDTDKLHDLARQVNEQISYSGSRPVSLELGSGHGGWSLFMAALGFDAYGIEAERYLVRTSRGLEREARSLGLIDADPTCRFERGNYYTGAFKQDFSGRPVDPIEQHVGKLWLRGDPYQKMGIGVADADVIYSFAWPNQAGRLGAFLQEEAKPSALIVLPFTLSKAIDAGLSGEVTGYDRFYKPAMLRKDA